ncbi:adenosylcobinamide kinase/adenosylcobinamide phosphate guanyltransferase [Clostridium beijerinckii]|nr:adenosylcobinamide kinase/adenosylcobinamide phosphate guanyltransferase [Clostridium beijerinckii]
MNYLIIGGSKSGKSEVGEKIALTLSRESKSMIWCKSRAKQKNMRRVSLDKVIYIATMKPYDKEDEQRIKKHIQNREGLNFITLEVQRNLHEIINNIKSDDTVLLDSITSLLTNEMFIGNEIINNPSTNILNGLKQIIKKAQNTVVVSDYIFNDAIEYDEITEKFKRELAIINKELAKSCDNVIECSFGNVKYLKSVKETGL